MLGMRRSRRRNPCRTRSTPRPRAFHHFSQYRGIQAQWWLPHGRGGRDLRAGWVELRALAPDALTWLSLPTPLKLTVAGMIAVYLPPGQYRFTITTATAVNCSVAGVPIFRWPAGSDSHEARCAPLPTGLPCGDLFVRRGGLLQGLSRLSVAGLKQRRPSTGQSLNSRSRLSVMVEL